MSEKSSEMPVTAALRVDGGAEAPLSVNLTTPPAFPFT